MFRISLVRNVTDPVTVYYHTGAQHSAPCAQTSLSLKFDTTTLVNIGGVLLTPN